MANRYLKPESPWLLALLAALVALGPLSVDMYLPAMPMMMRALDTDIGQMHLTLSSYLTGFALFHLVCGPLADRYGRKPVLVAGTLVFVAACIGCAQSTTVEELLVFRFLQGAGGCVGPTLARTVARDIFGPRDAARALSLIAMLMALAPAVAPTLGGFVLLVLPWPVIFIFLACYGLLMIFLLQVYLGESLPQRQSLHPLNIGRNYARLITDLPYLSVTIASALIYAGLMAYLSSASFVYIEMLGVPVQYFGFIFLILFNSELLFNFSAMCSCSTIELYYFILSFIKDITFIYLSPFYSVILSIFFCISIAAISFFNSTSFSLLYIYLFSTSIGRSFIFI